ncbi:hypothetical protein [Paenibacillus tengchongensis]|uniref:hypothetical protein n=1 Tax=Paenibacillus tengchongensis TaxID=2608684 RepID=UPI00124E2251|nr:hypothetical protein [Paenibacillus tengchongensis]
MQELRLQKQTRVVSFRIAEEAGEFIVFDMSLSGPVRQRTRYSGPDFKEAWQAVEAILGDTDIPAALQRFAG